MRGVSGPDALPAELESFLFRAIKLLDGGTPEFWLVARTFPRLSKHEAFDALCPCYSGAPRATPTATAVAI
jgi:hypothetical protein